MHVRHRAPMCVTQQRFCYWTAFSSSSDENRRLLTDGGLQRGPTPFASYCTLMCYCVPLYLLSFCNVLLHSPSKNLGAAWQNKGTCILPIRSVPSKIRNIRNRKISFSRFLYRSELFLTCHRRRYMRRQPRQACRACFALQVNSAC